MFAICNNAKPMELRMAYFVQDYEKKFWKYEITAFLSFSLKEILSSKNWKKDAVYQKQ